MDGGEEVGDDFGICRLIVDCGWSAVRGGSSDAAMKPVIWPGVLIVCGYAMNCATIFNALMMSCRETAFMIAELVEEAFDMFDVDG